MVDLSPRRLARFLFYEQGKTLTTTQVHVWSVLLGAALGVFVTGYSYAIEGLLILLWRTLPNGLEQAGIVGEAFPLFHLNWLIPLIYGGLLAGVLLWLMKRRRLTTGSIVSAIRGVHKDGLVSSRSFLPMLFVSLITITAGGSAGPEASVIIMGGGVSQLLNLLLKQPMRERRILTLCGMSAALAAFFGMPLTGAIFVLEVPHHNGLEYFEAVSPAVCSSVLAAIVNKLITQRPLGGRVAYPAIPEQLDVTDLGWSVLLGIIAGLTALLFILLMKTMKVHRSCPVILYLSHSSLSLS